MHWGSFHIRVDYIPAKWQMSKMCLPKEKKTERLLLFLLHEFVCRNVFILILHQWEKKAVEDEKNVNQETPFLLFFPFLFFTVALLHKKITTTSHSIREATPAQATMEIFFHPFFFSILFLFVGWFLSFFFLIFISLHIFPFNFYLLRFFMF